MWHLVLNLSNVTHWTERGPRFGRYWWCTLPPQETPPSKTQTPLFRWILKSVSLNLLLNRVLIYTVYKYIYIYLSIKHIQTIYSIWNIMKPLSDTLRSLEKSPQIQSWRPEMSWGPCPIFPILQVLGNLLAQIRAAICRIHLDGIHLSGDSVIRDFVCRKSTWWKNMIADFSWFQLILDVIK